MYFAGHMYEFDWPQFMQSAAFTTNSFMWGNRLMNRRHTPHSIYSILLKAKDGVATATSNNHCEFPLVSIEKGTAESE